MEEISSVSQQKRSLSQCSFNNQNFHRSRHKSDTDTTRNHESLSLKEELAMASEIGRMTYGMTQLAIHDESTDAEALGIQKGDEQQMKALSLFEEGRNIFLTGKAGTGKSWTTRRIAETAHSQLKKVHITAPTGIAAINIHGQTIHSWGGFQLGEYYCDFDKMMGKTTREMIEKTDVLIIDEVSMLDGHLFDVLECMISIIRHFSVVKDIVRNIKEISSRMCDNEGISKETANSIMSPYMLKMRWEMDENGLGHIAPWGGLQLILVGDFFQLSPIANRSDIFMENGKPTYVPKIGRQGSYAFESHAWHNSELHTVELNTVYRQTEGEGLFELLNAIREGETNLRFKHNAALNALIKPLDKRDDKITPTELHSLNRTVDQVNKYNLNILDGEIHKFRSLDEVTFDYMYTKRLIRKYDINELVGMDYLLSSVYPVPPTPELCDARNELTELQAKKNELLAKEDYGALQSLKLKEANLKEKVNTLEKEHIENTKMSVESISKYLKEKGRESIDDNPDSNSMDIEKTSQTLFENFKQFDAQLMKDYATLKEHANNQFFHGKCRVDHEINLKAESQVMLLWNLDIAEQLANGSRGVLEKFVPVSSYHRLLLSEFRKRHRDGNDMIDKHIERPQEDIKEPEKTNGDEKIETSVKTNAEDRKEDDTLSKAELENDFNYCIDEPTLQELKGTLKELNNSALDREMSCIKKILPTDMTSLPYVQFTNGKKRIILPVSFKKEFRGYARADRWQIPLCLAWAISIHKSQGMTIDLLRVDLKRCFANGQAYVACSRGRSLDCMTVENFNMDEIKTCDKVKKFYEAQKEGGRPYMTTWSDTIKSFDDETKKKINLEYEYKNTKCPRCGSLCIVRIVSKNNHNKGRMFVTCENKERGHYFKFIT